MYEQEKYELRARAARKLGLPDAEAVRMFLLPKFARHTTVTPKKRIAKLKAHLQRCINELLKDGPIEPAENSIPTSASVQENDARVCATCRGSCCQKGAEHGYLNKDDLRRGAAHIAGATASHLVEAWLAHVPRRGYKGSCIYHGAKGCGLPKQMRSVVCNDYSCSVLDQIRTRAQAPDTGLVVVSRKETSTKIKSCWMRN